MRRTALLAIVLLLILWNVRAFATEAKTVPVETVSAKMTPVKMVPVKMQLVLKNTGSDDSVSENTVSDDSVSRNTVSDDSVSGNFAFDPDDVEYEDGFDVLHMFYTEENVEELARVITGEARENTHLQKAAVAWCVLNRVDAWEMSISEVLNEPGAFRPAKTPDDEDRIIAREILNRWSSEKRGFEDSGRVLPAEYLFFSGDGDVNRFRINFEADGNFYDWSLDSPYEEDLKG